MKKLITSLTAVCLLAAFGMGSAFAQKQWTIMPKAGINVSNMTNTDGDYKVGLVTGVEVEYRVSSLIRISAGGAYSQQGFKGSEDGATLKVRMDYFDIPVLANFYVTKGLALKTGVQPGFLVNDKAVVSGYGTSIKVKLSDALDASEVYQSKINHVELSIPFGISYEFMNVQLDLRYNLGVTNALWVNLEESRHSVFQFTLGYRF